MHVDPAHRRQSGPSLALSRRYTRTTRFAHTRALARVKSTTQWEDGAMGVSKRLGTTLVGLSSLVLLSACDDKDFTNVVIVPRVATSIITVSGDSQTAVVGGALAAPLAVRVLDQDGFALPGAVVNWAVL